MACTGLVAATDANGHTIIYVAANDFAGGTGSYVVAFDTTNNALNIVSSTLTPNIGYRGVAVVPGTTTTFVTRPMSFAAPSPASTPGPSPSSTPPATVLGAVAALSAGAQVSQSQLVTP
jgi:hypothetical protein